MNPEYFIDSLAVFTEQYLQHNPDHPYSNNISQYVDKRGVLKLYHVYNTIITHTHGSVLDVGSGIGIAKLVDPRILTANLPANYYFNQGPANYFAEVEEFFNLEKDYVCRDCARHQRWIETDHSFDSIILHRFLPWDNTVTNKTLTNIFVEIDRLLNDNGVLIYTPIDITRLNVESWERINTGMYTFKITKQQIYDTIQTYKVL
jgi:SAM-dependent methyltransferase